MEQLAEKLTELFRPWYKNGLPEELAFGDIAARNFVRGSMSRAAQSSVKLKMPFGVFAIIGMEYAPRAARAWWPKERLLMEDVSCALRLVEIRAGARQMIPQILTERLVFLLDQYLEYVGSPWEEEKLWKAVDQFIRQVPADQLP